MINISIFHKTDDVLIVDAFKTGVLYGIGNSVDKDAMMYTMCSIRLGIGLGLLFLCAGTIIYQRIKRRNKVTLMTTHVPHQSQLKLAK